MTKRIYENRDQLQWLLTAAEGTSVVTASGDVYVKSGSHWTYQSDPSIQFRSPELADFVLVERHTPNPRDMLAAVREGHDAVATLQRVLRR